jgi:hypothetical protein
MGQESKYNHISVEDILKILEVYDKTFGLTHHNFIPDIETQSVVVKMELDKLKNN